MSCGVGCRCDLDQESLWLWRRLATVALKWPLAREHSYAMGVSLKRKDNNNTRSSNRRQNNTE